MADDDKKGKLALVTTTTGVAKKIDLPNIDDLDIENLNVDKLRETMLKNIYVVEAALFQQAGFEYKRVNSIRLLVSSLEKELFNDTAMAALTPDQKIKLYNNLTQNMSKSLEFLGKLHDNVTSGIDTLNKIEKLKNETDAVKKSEQIPGGTSALEDIKKAILDKIKDRVQK